MRFFENFSKLALGALLLLPAAAGQNLTSEQAFNSKRTLSVGIVSITECSRARRQGRANG